MDGMDYFDPLYGAVKLNNIFFDLLSQKELLRLQSIGLMNYRSLNKLSLTSITRLEHSIGTAILFDVMCKNNSYLRSRYNEYICASLYHDVNCASFGHAVEWAISRYSKFDHVEQTSWLLNKSPTINFDKPLSPGASPSGTISKELLNRYAINTDFVESIIKGKESCIVCDKAMDLDNIDNVSRMALYMGLDFSRDLPIRLASSLNISPDKSVFVVERQNLSLISDWIDLRYRVYRSFIYSPDYFSYEFMIFSLVRELFFESGEAALRNIKSLTDDELLRKCVEMNNSEVSKIANRMLTYDLPDCTYIISSDEISLKEHFNRHENYLIFKQNVADIVNSEMTLLSLSDFDIHVTTDYRKTHRKVTVLVDGNLVEIGKDVSNVLFGLIINSKNKSQWSQLLVSAILNCLTLNGGNARIEENFLMSANQSLFDE